MKILIGIDPDVEKSGVATYGCESASMTVKSMTFFQLYDYLKTTAEHPSVQLKVYIEAGWLIKKSNFSKWNRRGSKAAGERIAKNVGSNHETGRKIVEMCQYLGIEHELVMPMGKMTPEYFKAMTGITTRNQDQIDAGALIWGRV